MHAAIESFRNNIRFWARFRAGFCPASIELVVIGVGDEAVRRGRLLKRSVSPLRQVLTGKRFPKSF
jgi:hypothetical protein